MATVTVTLPAVSAIGGLPFLFLFVEAGPRSRLQDAVIIVISQFFLPCFGPTSLSGISSLIARTRFGLAASTSSSDPTPSGCHRVASAPR
jgi:hypothetical protein